jgi:hypothetical protein
VDQTALEVEISSKRPPPTDEKCAGLRKQQQLDRRQLEKQGITCQQLALFVAIGGPTSRPLGPTAAIAGG